MASNVGRNDPCPCGSGKKFKHCCENKLRLSAQQVQALKAQIPMALRSAQSEQRAGNQNQAEHIYRQVLVLSPSHPDALHFLGALLLQQGRVDEAIKTIASAVKTNPLNFEAYNNLAFAFHQRGRLEDALSNYRKALALKPDYVGALFNMHALLLERGKLDAALACLESIIQLCPLDEDSRYMYALLLDYDGQETSAHKQFELLGSGSALTQSRLDAWRYLKAAGAASIPIMGSMYDVFKYCIASAPKSGLVMEFGVRFGNTIRQLAELCGSAQQVHGFDSFEGLPEAWHNESKGSYSTQGKMPDVPSNVMLHAGWFDSTLPDFLNRTPGTVKLINIDCDIYSSTKTVLDSLSTRVVAGSVIVFDEYIGNERWREDEYKAFQEAVARYGWQYEYLCFSPFTKQVAVRITRV